MNVKTLCLSILHDGEASGYDIRRLCTEGAFAYFVEASFGSIYPALARLEADGFVTSRTEQHDSKPARKVYAITEAGRRQLLDEMSQPLGPNIFRSPFLMFARFAHLLPRELVIERCNEVLARTEQDLTNIDSAECDVESTASDKWVIDYGRKVMTVAHDYVRTHMHQLIDLARDDARKDAAE